MFNQPFMADLIVLSEQVSILFAVISLVLVCFVAIARLNTAWRRQADLGKTAYHATMFITSLAVLLKVIFIVGHHL